MIGVLIPKSRQGESKMLRLAVAAGAREEGPLEVPGTPVCEAADPVGPPFEAMCPFDQDSRLTKRTPDVCPANQRRPRLVEGCVPRRWPGDELRAKAAGVKEETPSNETRNLKVSPTVRARWDSCRSWWHREHSCNPYLSVSLHISSPGENVPDAVLQADELLVRVCSDEPQRQFVALRAANNVLRRRFAQRV